MTFQGFFGRRPAVAAFLAGSSIAALAAAQDYAPPPANNYPQPGYQQPAAGAYPVAGSYPAAQRPLQAPAAPGRYAAPGGFPNNQYPNSQAAYQQPAYGPAQPGGGYPPASQIPATQPGVVGRLIVPVENQEPVAAAAATPAVAPAGALPSISQIAPAQPGEHPLGPCIRWAKTAYAELCKIEDYSATMIKRERIDGNLNDHEYLFIKVRHQPFSVYMYFLGPAKVKGQEAMYVDGANDGNLLAHPNGIRHKLIGTVSLKPNSMLAMAGQRYPITELGIRRLTQRLIEVGEHDMQFGECEVKLLPGAKINGRECTCIQVMHPNPRKEFIFNMARIYVDNQLNVPIRYEAYEWPKEPGGAPQLIEEYTYLNLKLNNGFKDEDFDPKNPNYQFQ